jgi:magnesium-transporting ATPase (P-type)
MTRFASHISTLLYAALLAILAFVTAVILATVGALIIDTISPGALSAIHFNPQALDMETPGIIAVMLIQLGLAWAALLPLIQMLRSTAAGEPFTSANVKRLNWIAGTIAVAFLLQFALPTILPLGAKDMVKPMGVDSVFAILLTLVLAQVFREGVRLREEAEGTI